MGDNDNIGDFFRNKLNKSDKSGDAWDRPDANVWINAQAEIFAEEPTKKRSFLWLWFLSFLLISSAVGVYIGSLKKQVIKLEETLEKQEIAIENLRKTSPNPCISIER